MTCKEWSIRCWKGHKLLLGLSNLVCKLTIHSANLRDLLSINTIRMTKSSRPQRGWVSSASGCGWGSGACGHGVGAGGCCLVVYTHISWACSDSTIGWPANMVSTSCMDEFFITSWPIVRGSLPSSSSSSSLSSFSSSSSSSYSSSLSPSLSISTLPSKSIQSGASTLSDMCISTSESCFESYLPSDSSVWLL